MIPTSLTPNEERVLIFAPVGCDGAMAREVLSQVSIAAYICDSVKALCKEIKQGVGAILITEEALWDKSLDTLIDEFEDQPSWSEIPIVVAADIDNDFYKREHLLHRLENYKVTLLSRPVAVVSLASTLRSALAARHRQYQVRDLMVNLHTELRLRDEFLATLSHELRNPLGAVRNAVQLMKMAEIDNEVLRDSRDIIDRQTADLSRLLDDLLDVARVTQGKISLKVAKFSLRQLLEEMVRDMRQAHLIDREVLLTLPNDEMIVKGDRLRIKQVFLNLLNNADKFSEEDGKISIHASTTDRQVKVAVRDHGIGIDRDMLDSVFHLFSQATRSTRSSRGGLGIGLTVVQSLVRMHQGKVTVTSEGAGKGAEFTVYLPKVQTAARPVQHGLDLPPRPRRQRAQGLLIIDDDRDGGLSLKALLEADKHHVVVCSDGHSGLARARSMRPDAILLDIGLPDCSGYEIARLLRSDPEFSDTLFVALTGYGSEQDRRRAKEAGFDHHLTKPINFTELRAILRDGAPLPGQAVGGHY